MTMRNPKSVSIRMLNLPMITTMVITQLLKKAIRLRNQVNSLEVTVVIEESIFPNNNSCSNNRFTSSMLPKES